MQKEPPTGGGATRWTAVEYGRKDAHSGRPDSGHERKPPEKIIGFHRRSAATAAAKNTCRRQRTCREIQAIAIL
jgi:hypothetical protein